MDSKWSIKKLYDSKKKIYLLSAVIGVLIVIIIGTTVHAHSKKSVLNEVKVSFTGYSGHGYATISGDKLVDNIFTITGRAAGVDEKTINDVVNSYNNDESNPLTDTYGGYGSSSTTTGAINTLSSDKINNWREWSKDTQYTLSNTSGLKNGDKVTLKVKTNIKDNPVKSEEKTFAVTGLKKPENKKTSQIFDDLKVSFSGVSGNGNLVITSKKEKYQTTVKVSKSSKLSNGDKIKVTLPNDLLNTDESTVYVGNKTKEYEVSGLSDLSNIANVNEVTDFANASINSHKSDSENYTFEGVYVNELDSDSSSNSTYSGRSTSDEGEITVGSPDSNASSSLENSFTLSVLYEKKSTYSFMDKTETSYVYLNLNSVPLVDNKFDLSKVSSSSVFPSTLSADTLDLAKHDMATKGVLLK